MNQLIIDYTPAVMVGIFGFLLLTAGILLGKSVMDLVKEKPTR